MIFNTLVIYPTVLNIALFIIHLELFSSLFGWKILEIFYRYEKKHQESPRTLVVG